MTEQDAQDSKPKIGTKHVVWHSLRVSWWLLALPVVFALVIAVSLIDRDITAPTWIKAKMEERAAELLALWRKWPRYRGSFLPEASSFNKTR